MKKHNKRQTTRALCLRKECTVGLDVSDDYTYAAVVSKSGDLLVEDRFPTREPAVRRWLSAALAQWHWKPEPHFAKENQNHLGLTLRLGVFA